MSSSSLQDSADDDTREDTPGLDDSTSDSESDVVEEEEEEEEKKTVRLSNDFDPALESMYQRVNHRNTETGTDDIYQNDDGQTNMSPLPLQGAVALTEGERHDWSLAIAETFSKAITPGNAEQRVTNIVIKNLQLSLTKKTEVASLKAHNVFMGSQQVIHPSTSSGGAENKQETENSPTEIPKHPEIQRIRDATVSEIHTWTSGLIKTQFVDEIVERIDAGENWITVTGNGGDGKTTVAYMVLDEMMKRRKEVFRVKTVEDYYTITKNTDQCVIMLNDVIGAFALDNMAFSTWKPVMFDAMEQISKAKESGQPCGVICVFVQRSNVVREVERHLGKHKSSILGENALSNLSLLPLTEQTAILDYHLIQKNINDVSEEEKRKVIGKSISYGFPHCCKLFAELKSRRKQADIVDFFCSALEILDATTDVYLENENLNKLFKKLLQKDGRLDISEIEDNDQRSDMLKSSHPLTGSYLSNTEGIITFTHPSIYESAANCIAKRDIVFALKYFSPSFITQKMRFEEPNVHAIDASRSVTVPPTRENIQRLCKRFAPSVLNRQFDVLGYPFFQNEDFCRAFFSTIIEKNRLLIFFNPHFSKQKRRMPIDGMDKTGSTMLYKVLQYGNATAARVLIENGASVTMTNSKPKTGFHYLCESGNSDAGIVELMIKHGADVNKTNDDGQTPFHSLCMRDNVDASVVELMIQHGADVNTTDWRGQTPFHYLCKRGDVDASVVELMIKHGADVNKTNDDGQTAFHYLCWSGNVDASVVELMIQHGADVNKTDGGGMTAFHYLCWSGNVDASVVELMRKHGADVNKTDGGGQTAFHRLCKNDTVDASVVELMIKHGADVNKTDRYGQTPFHYLCGNGNVDASVVELMIKHGADVNKTDDGGTTAFHYLCGSGTANACVVELMIKHGAGVNKTDDDGQTAFHYLCWSGTADASVVELMIKHGAGVNKTDDDGKTAFHYLCGSGTANASVVELMIKHGADVNKTDDGGDKEYDFLRAIRKVDASVVELMIKHGADVNKIDRMGKTAFHYLRVRSSRRRPGFESPHGYNM